MRRFRLSRTIQMEDELLEEHSFFKQYETESFFVMICDESFQTVYVSGSRAKEQIMRNKIEKEKEMYQEDAKAELDAEKEKNYSKRKDTAKRK